ncbi:MAG: TIGR02281 family clan AA aspartic protease [Nitrosomonadales bacterium]|nr:TIGR02281 family clan AA aspartic protease [Nitrosomonadales bacterium]
MTESTNHEPGSALFARIQQMVSERGVDIRPHLSGHALRLEFADAQRILINFDALTQNVWVATRSGGIEFIHRDGIWRAHDQGELFARLGELIEQTIASNPLNARAPAARQPHTPKHSDPVIYYEAKQGHGLRNVLIVMLAGLAGFWAAQRSNQPEATANDTRVQAETVSLSQLDPGQQCEGGFPANGSITVFPESGQGADSPNDPEITLKNDHTHPLLLIFAAPRTVIPSMSVLVHARQSVTLHLPAGQYDMMFGVGTSWCNARRGFSDGHILKFDKSLTVEMDKPMQLAMQSSGAGMEDFQLFVKTAAPEVALPPPTFSGDGSMEVQRQANGHFYLPGTIENVPVTFMVDTGASVTSISGDIARQAGIRNCKEVQFQTANGTATGCIALVTRMTLGNFVLENITVAVMPNMDTNLLGANVLRNYQVSQSDSIMLIGRR